MQTVNLQLPALPLYLTWGKIKFSGALLQQARIIETDKTPGRRFYFYFIFPVSVCVCVCMECGNIGIFIGFHTFMRIYTTPPLVDHF